MLKRPLHWLKIGSSVLNERPARKAKVRESLSIIIVIGHIIFAGGRYYLRPGYTFFSPATANFGPSGNSVGNMFKLTSGTDQVHR